MQYPRYSEYTEIPVNWLSPIPKHWKLTSFNRMLRGIKDGTHGTHPRVADGYPLLSAKNVQNLFLDIGEAESFISKEEHESIVANGYPVKNDVLVTCVGTIGRSFVYNLDEPLSFQRSVAFLRLEENLYPKYCKYFIESKGYQEYLHSVAKVSAQSGVYMGDISKSPILDVPFDEQQKIATFLDHKTQQIDRLIEKKKALIEKLEEKRIAVITQAVTTGLDKKAKLKSSGVDWLGDIPRHWEMMRFRFLLKNGHDGMKIGPFGSQIKAEQLTSEGFKVYGQENVISNNFLLGHRFLDERKFNELRVYEIFHGDILITMMGSSGNCQLAPADMEQGIMDSHLIRLRTNEKMEAEFSKLLIDEAHYVKFQMLLLGKGSIMHGLNSSIIKSLNFCVPPIEEQKEILEFLSIETGQIDGLIDKAESTINRLEEYRSSLITSAVTGKIDVSEVELPREVN